MEEVYEKKGRTTACGSVMHCGAAAPVLCGRGRDPRDLNVHGGAPWAACLGLHLRDDLTRAECSL